MGTPEHDEISGTDTTGHEWDGIKELNTPLPKWWLYTMYATIIWSVVYCVLYPAIPMVTTATKGVLGYSSRGDVAAALKDAKAAQSQYLEKIEKLSLSEIRDDKELFQFAVAGGKSAFAVNCIQCHGSGAAGSKGFPNLNDDEWLWGGSLEAIHTSIKHGIRFEKDEDTRDSEMPAFGRDELLEQEQINEVAEYVLSLSGQSTDADAVAKGQEVFAENCAACHGEGGEGIREMGAPSLKDAIWLYGGDKETVVETISNSRKGVMPAWAQRLDVATIKQLAVYVHALGGGE